MFNDTKYTRTYYRLMERARYRMLTGYTEGHHIIPKSLGGTDELSNIAVLTAREHFIAHILLTKMTMGEAKFKMFCAAIRVGANEKINGQMYRKGNSRVYENMRNEHRLMMSERMKGNDFKKGKPDSEETRRRKSESMSKSEVQGRWERTPEYRAKLSSDRTGKNMGSDNVMASAENRAKVSASKVGRKRFYSPDRSQFKYVLPGNEPDGWTLAG